MSSNVRTAISLGRPWALHQFQRRQRSTLNGVRPPRRMRSDQIADQFDIRSTHFAPLHYHILCHGAKITAITPCEFSLNAVLSTFSCYCYAVNGYFICNSYPCLSGLWVFTN